MKYESICMIENQRKSSDSLKLEAEQIALEQYGIKGVAIPLVGESDYNFKIESGDENYLLKISRPFANEKQIHFQEEILQFIQSSDTTINTPSIVKSILGELTVQIENEDGAIQHVRLLSWMEGRLWSKVNPHNKELLHSLGNEAARITKALSDFDHPLAHRYFEWDIAQGLWTSEYLSLFNSEQRLIVSHFQKLFNCSQHLYTTLRKGIVHNDVNDNNIIVNDDLLHPKVKSIIDYGDAIYTHVINDLAITIAYAIMDKPDPLASALPIVKGYHEVYPLNKYELEVLYILIGMRLVISVTKSAINREDEPENDYLQISEKAAWDVLEKWKEVDKKLAHCSFRHACGLSPHPHEEEFNKWVENQNIDLSSMFPQQKFTAVFPVDISVSSKWLGLEEEIADIDLSIFKLKRLQKEHSTKLLAGGYLEPRYIYTTDAYRLEGINGSKYRTVHLGVDFWLDPLTEIHAPLDGKVVSVFNNDNDKDYGPTIILSHEMDHGFTFYSLYGHLSKTSLDVLQLGQEVKKGELIAFIGSPSENGNWAPHLHFQLMHDLLGNMHDFPGVAFPDEIDVWKSICPDPNLLFKSEELITPVPENIEDTLKFREEHLGKSLSLSYSKPLNIVRGSGAFLIDALGRKYLDTVNNVAHVGHENAKVVKAGQRQMALLNTNTRYLNENINAFAEELLSTLPEELSVVHFVNSGSEANELALRMAQAYTGEKDVIAIEVGYHGNTNACIAISSYKFDGKGGNGAPEHTHIVPLPDSYRGLYQGNDTGVKYANHVQDKIDSIYEKGRKPAAFIAESIVSCGGQIELPDGYLNSAFEMTRKAGGLCIADEVQVGCGRVGTHFWGFQMHDVLPDIVSIGKPIGNGHPLAAVVCTKKVADAFANGMEYFNTFGGNPVSSVIGKEVLSEIKERGLQENALEVGDFLKEELKKLQVKYPIIGDIRGQGLFLGIELIDKNKTPLPIHTDYLVSRMKEMGILMSIDGKDHNVLKVKPPMVFSIANAKELLYRIEKVLQEDFMK